MARQVLKDVGIWIQGTDFTGVSNTLSAELSADTPESTNFDSGGWREYEPGLKTATLSFEGFYDTEETDAEAFASLGNEQSVLVVPAGTNPGDVAHIVPIVHSGHTPFTGSVGELGTFTYAGAGDHRPYRGRVLDIRDGLDAATNQTLQDFGVIPVGHAQRVWVHVKVVTAGTLRVALRSSSAASGQTVHQRDITGDITETGVYELTVQSGSLQPITDRFWGLGYSITSLAGEFDIAAASLYGNAQVIIPETPLTPAPPAPGTITLRGGLGTSNIPGASHLTIQGQNHLLTFPPFTNMRVYIARDSSQPDITSVVLQSDPTMQNQFAAFTKFSTTVTVAGVHYSVWYSNQSLTFASQDVFIVT